MHYEDCRSCGFKGIEHGLSTLDSVHKWVNSQHPERGLWCGGKNIDSWRLELKRDLRFIKEELAKIKGEIVQLKHSLHEQQALTHDRRNFGLILLAGVFLPLSFASTFFGMNINTMTLADQSSFSNYTSDWINNSPLDTQNSTRALASTIVTSGTLTFS